VCGREEVHAGFLWGNLKGKDNLEDLAVNASLILRWIFRKWDVGTWTALIWLRIGISGRNL
jgi:hypothetical protein